MTKEEFAKAYLSLTPENRIKLDNKISELLEEQRSFEVFKKGSS